MTLHLVGTAEAAAMIGVDRSRIIKLVRDGKLAPATKLPARTGAYLFDRQHVENLAHERSRERAA